MHNESEEQDAFSLMSTMNNSSSHSTTDTQRHTLPLFIPWYTAKTPILSNNLMYTSLSKRFIIGQESNAFVEYYFECMIQTNNAKACYLHSILKNQIIRSIQECMLTFFSNELELISIPTAIFDFTYNFDDVYIAMDPTKRLILYFEKNKFKWVALNSPTAIKRLHFTKHIASIYLENGQLIRILPLSVYKQNKCGMEQKSINKHVNIDWIVHGILEKSCCNSTNYILSHQLSRQQQDKLIFQKLCIEQCTRFDSKSNIKTANIILTHVLCTEYGIIIRDMNGEYGYLQCGKSKFLQNKNVVITSEKCMAKLFGKSYCQRMDKNHKLISRRNNKEKWMKKPNQNKCLKISKYCFNGCCKMHCINQRYPEQCLFHKQYWRSIHKFEELRLQLCHRWD
eukprot:114288_1